MDSYITRRSKQQFQTTHHSNDWDENSKVSCTVRSFQDSPDPPAPRCLHLSELLGSPLSFQSQLNEEFEEPDEESFKSRSPGRVPRVGLAATGGGGGVFKIKLFGFFLDGKNFLSGQF